MSAVKVAPNVWWVGAVDYNVRDFHGYRTPFGTTYNAFLLTGEKTVVVDTVKHDFADEWLANIAEVVDPNKIDYIVSNHVEPDHSGSLPEIVKRNPTAPVFTSPNGIKGLKAYYKGDWNFQVVKSGETVRLGSHLLQFLLMPMVHWPDSMATWLPELKVLIPNDAFGQHTANAERFADEIGMDFIFDRARNYYANIVMPFGPPVQKVLEEVKKLDVEIIAPSHGAIWRSELPRLMQKYDDWSNYRTDPKLAVVSYDTMWGSTGILADRIAGELKDKGMEVKVINLRHDFISEVMGEALEAGTICLGSPTLNRGMMPQMAAMLHYMKGLGFKNRHGRAFGSWGWSGESAGLIDAALKEMGFELEPMLKVQYKPD